MKEIKAYQCDYGCGKYLKTKPAMKRHEDCCFWNPERKACDSCGNQIKGTETVYNPNHGGDPGSTDHEQSFRICDASGDDLYDINNLKSGCSLWVAQVEA